MAKTTGVLLAILLLSVASLTAFAQTEESNIESTYYGIEWGIIQWISYVVIAAGSIVILLLATNSVQRPASFASLPIYLFFALTIFVVFFILSISFLPSSIFSNSFPITTGPTQDSVNQTQWTLNIGSVPGSIGISGLQIPVYVIIAGILGAYIRYLYIGIGEFKRSFGPLLNDFKDSYHVFLNALDNYNAHTMQTISPWPPVFSFGSYIFKSHARRFANEVSLLDWDPPAMMFKLPMGKKDEPPVMDKEEIRAYKEKRRSLWSVIRHAQTEFDKQRFIIGMEVNTHILTNVGSFFLGPLLAVMAWLLLSISGTDGTEINGVLTFALVSFAIGLTTKAVITRVMNFVGEKLADETKPAETKDTKAAAITATTTTTDTKPAAAAVTTTTDTKPAAAAAVTTTTDTKPAAAVTTTTETPTIQTPSIIIDPNQAKAGQLLTVRGNGFQPNSRVTLQYNENGNADTVTQPFVETLPLSSRGEFDFQFRLAPGHPTGTYNLIAKDDDSKSASEEFTVL